MTHHTTRALVACLFTLGALAALLAGCSNTRRHEATPPDPRTPQPGPAVQTVPTVPGTMPSADATASPGVRSTGGPTAGPERERACDAAVLLPVAKQIVDDPAAGMAVERVEIVACRNGYARVFAAPKKTGSPVEGDQLFLRFSSGTWHLVDRGAGIDCGDADLKPATAKACAALT